MTAIQVGEIVVQLFRLPPLPGVPAQQLPQSLEEAHRGLRHVSWHKVTYFEGTLTQNGGDCAVRSGFHFVALVFAETVICRHGDGDTYALLARTWLRTTM